MIFRSPPRVGKTLCHHPLTIPPDARAQQALFLAKGQGKRDQSVRSGILKAVFLISLSIIALVVVWWLYFS